MFQGQSNFANVEATLFVRKLLAMEKVSKQLSATHIVYRKTNAQTYVGYQQIAHIFSACKTVANNASDKKLFNTNPWIRKE